MAEQVEIQAPDVAATIAELQTRYPDAVKVDDRKGYSGIIVANDKLVEVATAVRDQYGFNYLSSATAVDYLGQGDHMEMVYHAFSVPAGGPGLVFKAQTSRDEPSIPSLVSIYPGADFQEREAYDLYGIRFPGHPDLRRILLWEGFDGHPMRKDWQEAYFEQETKPFDSRWPGGNVFRAEEYNPFGHNVKYPAGFTLDNLHSEAEKDIQAGMNLGVSIEGDPDFRTDRLTNDLGAFFTPALYAIETREYILDFFEATAGSRMMCNYMRFGGVFKDIPERIKSVENLLNDRLRDMDTMDYLTTLINERLPYMVDQLDEFLTTSEIVISRSQGVGLLPPDMAIAYSAAGPLLRASGVAYDIRRAQPYSIYPELEFDVAVGYNGDIYDRYLIRMDEMRQSLRILKQLLPRLEQTRGESVFGGPTSYSVKVPAGESYGHVENPKGELGFYCVSTGGGNPFRYHVRAPSFINLTPLGEMCKGHKVADVVAILGSIDIVLGETDR